MKKVLSLFQRNYDGDRLVRDEVVPGAEWVQAGEGVASVKWDGTCCMVRDGKLYKRYDAWVSGKKKRTPPDGFEPAQDADPFTGHWPGWVPVADGAEDQYYREAWGHGHAIAEGAGTFGRVVKLDDGTYELCGPKVQGNPSNFTKHYLVQHGGAVIPDAPRDFDGLRAYFEGHPIVEGIVWHHADGRMVKIKRRDFGLLWPEKAPHV